MIVTKVAKEVGSINVIIPYMAYRIASKIKAAITTTTIAALLVLLGFI